MAHSVCRSGEVGRSGDEGRVVGGVDGGEEDAVVEVSLSLSPVAVEEVSMSWSLWVVVGVSMSWLLLVVTGVSMAWSLLVVVGVSMSSSTNSTVESGEGR